MQFSQHFLKKNREFVRVFNFGKTFECQSLKIKWLENKLDYFRFGIIVSTKIDKRAVIRNKIKRRLRAIFKEFAREIKSGFDFVVMTRPAIKTLDYHQIREIINNFLEKNNLRKVSF